MKKQLNWLRHDPPNDGTLDFSVERTVALVQQPTYALDLDIREICQRSEDLVCDLAGRHIVLTGGCGFLGRYFVAVIEWLNRTRLAEAPCRLTVIDNYISAGNFGKEIVSSAHRRVVNHDVIEPFVTDEPVDFIVHAAGIASPAYYRKNPLQTLQVAVWGTKNMLRLGEETGAKLVFMSSSEIYGNPDPSHIPTSEDYRGSVSCQGPRACYDESKRLGETLCHLFFNTHGVDTRIIRPFNVYGPGMQQHDYRVLPNFADKIRRGEALNLYGTGDQTRTFCYITDAIVGFLLVMLRGRPGDTYNIGNPRPEVSMLELIQHIERVLHRPVDHEVCVYPDSYPGDEPQRRCPDITRARTHLGFEPLIALDEGLTRFFDWALQHYQA